MTSKEIISEVQFFPPNFIINTRKWGNSFTSIRSQLYFSMLIEREEKVETSSSTNLWDENENILNHQ